MSEKTDTFEKYRREMMEMFRKARPCMEQGDSKEETVSDCARENICEETKEQICEKTENAAQPESEIAFEEDYHECPEEKGQNETTSFCPLCENKIALCEFSVECAEKRMPIENAQIVLHSDNGFFIRALTDKDGKTSEIPLFSDRAWRVSVTSPGYISVSRARITPVAGEKLTVPVRLDESLQLSDIFTEHDDSLFGT